MTVKSAFRARGKLKSMWPGNTKDGLTYISLGFEVGESNDMLFISPLVKNTTMYNLVEVFFDQNQGRNFPLRVELIERDEDPGWVTPRTEIIGGPLS